MTNKMKMPEIGKRYRSKICHSIISIVIGFYKGEVVVTTETWDNGVAITMANGAIFVDIDLFLEAYEELPSETKEDQPVVKEKPKFNCGPPICPECGEALKDFDWESAVNFPCKACHNDLEEKPKSIWKPINNSIRRDAWVFLNIGDMYAVPAQWNEYSSCFVLLESGRPLSEKTIPRGWIYQADLIKLIESLELRIKKLEEK